MELPNAIFRCFCFFKDLTAGGSNRNLAVIPNTNIPVSVETIEIILTIQIVLLQIQITLVHTTLVVLDLQLILMDKRSKMQLRHQVRYYTYRIKLVIADGDRNVDMILLFS
jgi:hypothetical protein